MRASCPVVAYDRAGEGYAESVGEWLANPHAYFKAFGLEAREFQRRHRSERLRTMTLVAPAEELVKLRPVCLSVDGAAEMVESWERVFAVATARLVNANPRAFAAMQHNGLLDWMGCSPDGASVAEMLATDTLCPTFGSMAEIVFRVQWLFLMCGIRLNEVIVQADSYTDEQWKDRKADLDRKRAEDKAFMEGRRAAQEAWAEAHPDETSPLRRRGIFYEGERGWKMNRREFINSSAALGALALAFGCRAEETKARVQMPVKVKKGKVAVVYFSRTGNTRFAAEQIAKLCGDAKLVEVKALKPYAAEYGACCDEAKPECRAGTLRPIQKIEGFDLAAFDAVLFGTPNWWGTLCPPMRTFVSENAAQLKGKTVCIFQTNGGGGMQRIGSDFEKLVLGATVLPPKAFSGAGIRNDPGIKSFVAERIEMV